MDVRNSLSNVNSNITVKISLTFSINVQTEPKAFTPGAGPSFHPMLYRFSPSPHLNILSAELHLPTPLLKEHTSLVPLPVTLFFP